jgi:hypothetical protein
VAAPVKSGECTGGEVVGKLVEKSLGVVGKRFEGNGEDGAHWVRVLHGCGIQPVGERQGWRGLVVVGSD